MNSAHLIGWSRSARCSPLAGCSGIQRDPPLQVWPDMRIQKKFKPQRSTDLFSDNRTSRRPPDGTVARGHDG